MKELIRLFRFYSFIDIVRLLKDFLLVKIFYPKNIRMIRQPAYIVGLKNIEFGKNFSAGTSLRLEVLEPEFIRHSVEGFSNNPKLIIGNNVTINNNVHIGVLSRVSIGNEVLIGSNVTIIDHEHGNYKGLNQDSPKTPPKLRKSIPQEIIIGDNIWIAENVIILPGTVIGNGCVIGANTLVKGLFGPNQMIVGSPAKTIKTYNESKKTWERYN